jgi:small-conductance mechanosensitive channel
MFDNLLETKCEMSLGKILLIFYLLASSSSLFPLLSKQWKNELEENRVAQHILGITTILALTILVSNGRFSVQRIFMYTLIGYMWFILSTKLDLQWNIIVMILLVGFLLYQDSNKHKDLKNEDDKNLSNGEKNQIQKKNKQSYIFIIVAIILISMGGTLLYSNKKEGQYGGGYSLTNFLLY